MRTASRRADVVVVGAGVNGLAAAWNLLLLGARSVVVLDAFETGHERGSSHDAGRIIRTSYHDLLYAALAMEAIREDWPRLERDAGAVLVHAVPGLFFGPAGGRMEDYAESAQASGAPVERIGTEIAARRFPAFAFAGDSVVLADRSAGIVDASATMVALRRLATQGGADIWDSCPALSWVADDAGVHVETPRGPIVADRLVVAAGSWVRALVPSLAPRFTPARQTVCYFDPPHRGGRAPEFPVWVWIGRDPHDHYYGMPPFGARGMKAARHRTATGAGDDPDAEPGAPDPAEIEDVRRFLASVLREPPGPAVATARCLYTNTADEDFVVGPLPEEPRVIVAAACSGHAFKFAPLTGRIVAEMALGRRCSAAAFESARARLSP